MDGKDSEKEIEYRRKRVLLVVYACSPYRGSEWEVGWRRVCETAKHFDTWVICKKQHNEDDIKKYLSENGEIPNLQFHFVPRTILEKIIKSVPGLLFISYYLWQRRAYHFAINLNEKYHFDLLHQVNLGTFREPGYLWKLEQPFIWGPVGGMENYPWRFLIKAGFWGAFGEAVRNIINVLQLRFSLRVRKAASKAAALFTVNSIGKLYFERIHKVSPIPMLDLGATTVLTNPPERRKRHGPLRILWISEKSHRKALHLLIEALSKLPESCRYELRILGKGPLEKRWRRLTCKTGIDKYCRWMPWLPREEALSQYNWADILVFTSLRDASGSVVMESMSRGLPVICFDHQGVSDIVTDTCGIKIPLTNPRDVINRLSNTISHLSQNKENLDKLAAGALERSRKYLWSRKIEQTVEIYHQVLGKHANFDKDFIGRK